MSPVNFTEATFTNRITGADLMARAAWSPREYMTGAMARPGELAAAVQTKSTAMIPSRLLVCEATAAIIAPGDAWCSSETRFEFCSPKKRKRYPQKKKNYL
jgi:hypothetical protein